MTGNLEADFQLPSGLPAYIPQAVTVDIEVDWTGWTPCVGGKEPCWSALPFLAPFALLDASVDLGKGPANRRAIAYNKERTGREYVRWQTIEVAVNLELDSKHLNKVMLNIEAVATSPEFGNMAYSLASSLRHVLAETITTVTTKANVMAAVKSLGRKVTESAGYIHDFISETRTKMKSPEWQQKIADDLAKVCRERECE